MAMNLVIRFSATLAAGHNQSGGAARFFCNFISLP